MSEIEKTTLLVRDRGEGVMDIRVEPVHKTAEVMMAVDAHEPRDDFAFVPNIYGNFAIQMRYGKSIGNILSKDSVDVVFVEDSPIEPLPIRLRLELRVRG